MIILSRDALPRRERGSMTIPLARLRPRLAVGEWELGPSAPVSCRLNDPDMHLYLFLYHNVLGTLLGLTAFLLVLVSATATPARPPVVLAGQGRKTPAPASATPSAGPPSWPDKDLKPRPRRRPYVQSLRTVSTYSLYVQPYLRWQRLISIATQACTVSFLLGSSPAPSPLSSGPFFADVMNDARVEDPAPDSRLGR